jgi:hypothetical protein
MHDIEALSFLIWIFLVFEKISERNVSCLLMPVKGNYLCVFNKHKLYLFIEIYWHKML